jgi:ubiquinone/menaquinone biosynthesis C-methylase UbiE
MILERLDIDHSEDRLQIVLHRARYDFVLARLTPRQQVLEIGTGAGVFAKELSIKSGSYIGIEFDHDACAEALRKTEGKAEIIQADARNLPFKDDQFSFIVCLEVLEHLGDWRAGVKHIHRCLQPEGTAIISVPYRCIGGKSGTNKYHLYEPGERELVSRFKQLFKNVEIYYQYFEEEWWMTVARKLHVRRFFGLAGIYTDLSAGLPRATSKLYIDEQSKGMNITLLLVVSGKKI